MRSHACTPSAKPCLGVLALTVCTREYLLSGAARRDQNESLQSLTREGNSLRKSEQMVDEMMRQGAETVNQLHEQRNTLKGAQRKMMVCCPIQLRTDGWNSSDCRMKEPHRC